MRVEKLALVRLRVATIAIIEAVRSCGMLGSRSREGKKILLSFANAVEYEREEKRGREEEREKE